VGHTLDSRFTLRWEASSFAGPKVGATKIRTLTIGKDKTRGFEAGWLNEKSMSQNRDLRA